APCAAHCCAIALPIPEDAPVIQTTFPFKLSTFAMKSCFLCFNKDGAAFHLPQMPVNARNNNASYQHHRYYRVYQNVYSRAGWLGESPHLMFYLPQHQTSTGFSVH